MGFVRSQIVTPNTAPEDRRVGHLIKTEISSDTRAVIIGYPSDSGVALNGGRIGAAEAPTFIRRMLYRMTPSALEYEAHSALLKHIVDLGDFQSTGDLERDLIEFGKVIAAYLRQGIVPMILGGGHEISYAHFLGYVEAQKKVSIVNIDAHLDVRPLKEGKGHSGSPFRQALTHPSKACTGYTVHGAAPQSCAKDHVDFIASHGGKIEWRGTPAGGNLFSPDQGAVMATFDIDVVDGAFAPGVSSPSAGGMSAEHFVDFANQAGRSPSVTSFDIVEVNPRFDRDNLTARLAALAVWNFLRGMAGR